MIQRIQTLFLFFVIILSIIFLSGSIISFTDTNEILTKIPLLGIFNSSDSQVDELILKSLPLTAISIIIALLALITIFLFKQRKVQLLILIFALILEILVIAYLGYYTSTIAKIAEELNLGIKSGIPVLNLVLLLLAYRGIKKDENLVKSYDRLR